MDQIKDMQYFGCILFCNLRKTRTQDHNRNYSFIARPYFNIEYSSLASIASCFPVIPCHFYFCKLTTEIEIGNNSFIFHKFWNSAISVKQYLIKARAGQAGGVTVYPPPLEPKNWPLPPPPPRIEPPSEARRLIFWGF